jgi:hypothetical protein
MSRQATPIKDLTFYDNYVPSLKAGEYEISVSQTLTVDTAKTEQSGGNTGIPPHPDPIDPVAQTFLVNGPRFVIPQADIQRVFPPRHGAGRYHEYLPMIVLNKRALLWERQLTFPDSLHIQDPYKYPWMALLVFTDDELPGPRRAHVPPGGQQNPTRSTSLPLNEIVADQTPGPPADVQGPSIRLEDDEDPAKIHANVIDVPAETFVNLVPSLADLCFLSHVREVSTDDKEPQNLKHEGWYSVVIANRFAAAPPKNSTGALTNVVHLVSLEGFESLLGMDAPVKPTKDFVRMISLASWTYTCLQDLSENFKQLMLDLIGANSTQGTGLLVRRPLADPGAPPAVGTIGITGEVLDGRVSTLALANDGGACAAIPAGTLLDIVAPAGASREQVTTSQVVIKGATSISIVEHSFTNMPKESWVGPAEAFNPTTPAQRLRAIEAVATTASTLQGAVTSIPLAGPAGAYQAIPEGTVLEIVDASGLIRQVITTSKAAERYASALEIDGADFKATMPAGSAIGPVAANETLDRLTDGYVPLSYVTRSGESTFAWYRGPLAPVVTPNFLSGPSAIVPETATAAMIYDQETGLFDQSYAVAFQTGRSLALASKPFATNLLQWRRDAHGRVGLLAEYMRSPHTKQRLQADGILDKNGDLTGSRVSDLAALLDADLISDAFKDFLATQFAEGLAKRIGREGRFTPLARAQIDAYPATPSPVVPADLKALMQHEDVRLLLECLSGLTPIGATTAALSGTQISIGLAGDGASIGLGLGTVIAVISPDGQDRAVVTIADASEAGAKALTIESFNFTTELPLASRVLLGEACIMPDQIVQWLARAALLYGVPFNNLIPDERMLPQGSIRFFYLDRNWIASLLDGALSIGIQSSRDALLQKQMRDPLHGNANAVLHQVRERLRAVPATGTPPLLGAIGGFVLRSQVVSGWPGLEIRAWSAADTDVPMQPLRLDRVAPSVMVGIFPDIPIKLEFNEPREGIVFGQEDEGIAVRLLPGMQGATPDNLGQKSEPEVWLKDIPKRTQPTNNPAVIVGGPDGLAQKLASKFPDNKPTLTPASFAVEMVKVPEQMLFVPEQGTD